MDAIEIKYRLSRQGYSISSLAVELDVTQGAVSIVINRHGTSRRIMLRISEIIGRDPAEVFPDKAHLFNPENIARNAA